MTGSYSRSGSSRRYRASSRCLCLFWSFPSRCWHLQSWRYRHIFIVTVIGHTMEKDCVITEGSWMALSRDRGTANQKVDQGYGLVCDIDGKIIDGFWVCGANQEQGIITARNREGFDPKKFLIGTRLRILPNHACPTDAQHPCYYVVNNSL